MGLTASSITATTYLISTHGMDLAYIRDAQLYTRLSVTRRMGFVLAIPQVAVLFPLVRGNRDV